MTCHFHLVCGLASHSRMLIQGSLTKLLHADPEPGIPAHRAPAAEAQHPAGSNAWPGCSQQPSGTHDNRHSQQHDGMQQDEDDLQDSSEAEVEAVAAAALAVNRGNPAAALIDLLNLARKRRLMADAGVQPAGL